MRLRIQRLQHITASYLLNYKIDKLLLKSNISFGKSISYVGIHECAATVQILAFSMVIF